MIAPSRSLEPIHVCHVITDLDTGGAETALFRLLQKFDRSRFRMSVVSLTDAGTIGPKITDLGIPVACLEMRAGALPFRGIVRLRKHLSRTAPDVIQSWMYHANLLATITGRLRRPPIPVIWNIRHSLYNLQDETPGTRWVIRASGMLSGLAAGIIYNSVQSRHQHEQKGYKAKLAHSIPNGFDVTGVAADVNIRSEVRASLEIPSDAPVIGHIGRFHPMKDHATFLKTAALLSRSHPDAHFLLCGRGVSRTNSDIAALSRELDPSRLHLLGERDDVPKLLSAMDVLCSSSFSEAFPNVLGEAMAAGLPCVTTDVGDSARIVGDTGFVAPPRDAAALAEAIGRVLQMNSAQRSELGQQAKARIEKHYLLSSVVSSYQDLYQSVYEAV